MGIARRRAYRVNTLIERLALIPMQRRAARPQLGDGQSLNLPSWPPGQRRAGFVYRRTFRLLAKLHEFVYRGTVYSSIGVHPCATKLPKNPRQHWIFSLAASKKAFLLPR